MEAVLIAETGRPSGSRPSRRLRAEGKVPAVVYGHGMEPLPISVVRRDLRSALTTGAGTNALLTLRVGGDEHLALVKDLQRHPVRNEVVHVDFVVVNRNQAIQVDVPIVLTGEAKDVLSQQGVIDQQLFSLLVDTTPGNIPDSFTVDVSGLSVGDSVRVADLDLPSGVTTEVDPEEAVVVAQISRAGIEAASLDEEAAAEAAAAEAGGDDAGDSAGS